MTNIQTWQQIGKITLSAAGIIDFQSIPGDFDHLKVILRCQDDAAGSVAATTSMRFNADAAQNYRGILNWTTSSGLTNSGLDNSANTYDLYEMLIGITAKKDTTNRWAATTILIPSYTTANRQHFYSTGISMGNTSTVTDNGYYIGSGEWVTTSVITRIQLGVYVGGGGALNNLSSGSEATLWGKRDV